MTAQHDYGIQVTGYSMSSFMMGIEMSLTMVGYSYEGMEDDLLFIYGVFFTFMMIPISVM